MNQTTVEKSASLQPPQPLTIDEDPINGKHYLAITDHTGDSKIMWSKDNQDEIDVARRTFNDMKAKGYGCFKVVGKKGEAGEQVDSFDPNAERYIFTKPMAGG